VTIGHFLSQITEVAARFLVISGRLVHSPICEVCHVGGCPHWVVHGRPRFAKRAFGDDRKVKIAAVHPDFGAASPLSLMGCSDWRPNRKRALEVRRPKRALPTTVSPVLPSLRARLSNVGLEAAVTL